MPYSTLSLQIRETSIVGDCKIPVGELQSAIGFSLDENTARLLQNNKASWETYLLQHIQPTALDGTPWKVAIRYLRIVETVSALSGKYEELHFQCELTPPKSYDIRHFYLGYEAVLREVASHKALISIQDDWKQGIIQNHHSPKEIGILEWDIRTGKLNPFLVHIESGSFWNGFQKMVELGMKHISEGTDHLLFLFLLLLPIPIFIHPLTKKQTQRTIRESAWLIFQVVTAFTIGHSITLLIGGIRFITLPSQGIEILIGISILYTAIHVVYPLFPDKEKRIALGFGLIHGLAFATTISPMHLNIHQQIASIIGFNIGIEIMQMGIILFVLPGLYLMSKTNYYLFFIRVMGLLGIVASVGWIWERVTGDVNGVTRWISYLEEYVISLYLGFLFIAFLLFGWQKKNSL